MAPSRRGPPLSAWPTPLAVNSSRPTPAEPPRHCGDHGPNPGGSWTQGRLMRSERSKATMGTPPTLGKVVSEMSFGVWVALLDRGGCSNHEGRRLRYHDTVCSRPYSKPSPQDPATRRRRTEDFRPARASATASASQEDLQGTVQGHPPHLAGPLPALPGCGRLNLCQCLQLGRHHQPRPALCSPPEPPSS